MLPVFVFTLFLSSSLLFLVQPMIGKMILPFLGGVPSVWNTCMVFFQAVLLAGYTYSHYLTTRLRPKTQVVTHLAVLATPLLVLPFAISPELAATVPTDDRAIFWLLGVLLIIVGLPFFAVSTMAPILQKWFSTTGHAHARDPYFLYAASNAGSLLGLLAYPFILEPLASLPDQARFWHVGYGFLLLMVATAGWLTWRYATAQGSAPIAHAPEHTNAPSNSPPTTRQRLEWVLYAFIPSSLMLGLTTYVATDIASVPLLWVIPLALYLLTFIFVFARRPLYAPAWLGRAMCLVAIAVTLAFLATATQPIWLILPLHIAMYFLAALVAHTRLAKARPHTKYLTEFYLLMSVGGVLGGLFNALIAPLIFTRVIEYMLVLALACAIREKASFEKAPENPRKDLLLGPLPGVLLLALIFGPRAAGFDIDAFAMVLIFGPAAIFAYFFIEHPRRFALAIISMVIAGGAFSSLHQRPLLAERNFFGTIRVADDRDGTYRLLIDGNTIHGRERLDTDECIPLSYYHSDGPTGALFRYHNARTANETSLSNIALIGVGIASLTCHGTPNQHWDLFEINPAVVAVASDPTYFTILQKAPIASHTWLVGDARLRLQQTDKRYDIIVVDAFSSGSIPIHLLTVEALELYRDRLTERGIIAFHISNNTLDLEPIVAATAAAAGLKGITIDDAYVTNSDVADGKDPSKWVLLSPAVSHLGPLFLQPSFTSLPHVTRPPWSDSFSNIIRALK